MSTPGYSLNSRLSLRANISWTFAGNVFYAGCLWGILVAMAKLGSPDMVGQYALGLAIVTPVMMFAGLKMRLVQATDARREYEFGDYLGLRLITTVLAMMVIIGIVLLSGYRRQTALVILAIGVAKGFESISDVFYGLLQQRERMDRIAKSKMIKGSLSVMVLVTGLYLTGSIFVGAVGLVVVSALILIGYDIRSGAMILKAGPQPGVPSSNESDQQEFMLPRWDIRTLAGLALLALPLGVVAALGALRDSIPRYFIEGYMGEQMLGIFAAMAYLFVVGNTVVLALGQSTSPLLAKHYAAGNGQAFRTLLRKLVGIGALLGGACVLAALVFGRQILTLLYQPEYARYEDVFVLLMVAAGIDYVSTFLHFGMIATRYFRIQILLFSVVTVITFLACIWLIPVAGIAGAAMAFIIANLVRALGSLSIIAYALHSNHRHSLK